MNRGGCKQFQKGFPTSQAVLGRGLPEKRVVTNRPALARTTQSKEMPGGVVSVSRWPISVGDVPGPRPFSIPSLMYAQKQQVVKRKCHPTERSPLPQYLIKPRRISDEHPSRTMSACIDTRSDTLQKLCLARFISCVTFIVGRCTRGLQLYLARKINPEHQRVTYSDNHWFLLMTATSWLAPSFSAVRRKLLTLGA